MMDVKQIKVFVLLLGVFFSASGFANQTNEQTKQAEIFWKKLQQGGKVVLVRHTAIDKEFASPFTLDESCFSERNLNETGKQQAVSIKQAFQKNNVFIEKVISSPYCRTKETAELAFGNYEVEAKLHLTKAIPAEQATIKIEQTRELIGNYQPSDKAANLVMVTHRPNILDLTNVNTQPADMVLLQPLGDGLFEVIAHLKYAANFK